MEDDRPACVVCGAPAGTCGPGRDPGMVKFHEWESPMDRPVRRREMIGPVYVHEEVYEQRAIPGTKRTTSILKFRKGQQISIEDAKAFDVPLVDELGRKITVSKQAAKPDVETQEVKAPRKQTQRRRATTKRRR